MRNWEEARLWTELLGREDVAGHDARLALETAMPDAVRVLGQAATSPTDFTLHDDEHAFRVSQLMANLIGDDGLGHLSSYELALLLFAAYLHDIGMTPERGLVAGLYTFLLTNEHGDLSHEDVGGFQRWLDQHGRGLVPPLLDGEDRLAALSNASRLVTGYCRERHAEWSVLWMASHLRDLPMGNYGGWLGDLQALCLSHNQGRSELLAPALDPRLVSAGTIVNLRYLACVLRVADVMDVDPERTPRVVFRQRTVSPQSAIFWHKDHEIVLEPAHDKVLATARPTSAMLHRAVISTVDDLDAELRLCRDLTERKSFSNCPGCEDLPHRWHWPAAATRDIEPRDNLYVYVDGDFRPDTDRILDLLGGVALYQTPFAAVRELLQNASDAVAERIAWMRLNWDDPNDEDRLASARSLNLIELSLSERDGHYWLECLDTGVGMTKGVITEQLLVSGSSYGSAVMELKRRCAEAGFALQRTGRFGIGVLSYFMLGDEVRLKTQRDPETGVSEGVGWEFISEGRESFGELRRLPPGASGTTVSLRLREDTIKGGAERWSQELLDYLADVLVEVPCSMRVRTDGGTRNIAPGWVRSDTALREVATRSLAGPQVDPLSQTAFRSDRQRAQEIERTAALEADRAEISAAMSLDITEGSLPGDLGSYRIAIPYFELPGGACFAYLRVLDEDECPQIQPIIETDGWRLENTILAGWNGMSVAVDVPIRTEDYAGILEVDFSGDAAGDLEVSRNKLALSESGYAALQDAWSALKARHYALVAGWEGSRYDSLSRAIAGASIASVGGCRWLTEQDGLSRWAPVSLPAVAESDFGFGGRVLRDPRWSGVELNVVRALILAGAGLVAWWPRTNGPERMLFTARGTDGFLSLWTTDRDGEPSHPVGATSQFPPGCQELLLWERGYGPGAVKVWNSENAAAFLATTDALSWCEAAMSDATELLRAGRDALTDRSRAAAWLCFQAANPDFLALEALGDTEPDLLPALLAAVYGPITTAQLPRMIKLGSYTSFCLSGNQIELLESPDTDLRPLFPDADFDDDDWSIDLPPG